MHIEVWSDIACPWCWLGKHHLEEALRRMPQLDVTVEMHSFELDPERHPTMPVLEHFRARDGDTRAVVASQNRLAKLGRAVGLEYDFARQQWANTFDAHRLHHLGIMSGRGPQVVERLMRAYHTEGADLADPATLRSLAVEVELEPAAVDALLGGDDFAEAVHRDEAAARELGIDGVPFFLFDEEYAVSGAQPVATFVEILTRLARAPAPPPPGDATA